MRRLAPLALMTFVLFLSTLVGTPVIPDLAARLGADSGATAAILSSALMTVVLLQFFTGGLADRYGRRLVLGGAALAGGLTSLGCALAGDWHWLLAMRILGGAADAVSMPALLGLTAEIAEGRQGTFFGVLRSAQGLSFIVGPAIGGALSFVSLRAPFLADAALSLAASGLLMALVPPQPTHAVQDHTWTQLRRLKTLFADRRYYAFALFCSVNNVAFPVLSAFVPVKARLLLGLVMAADITPAAGAAGTLGAFDAAVDLWLFAAPALALAVYQQVGREDLPILAAGLPALLALPVALAIRGARQPAIG